MMKHLLTAVLGAALFCTGLCGADKVFHRGGVTFPMEKISAERFAVKAVPAGKNLIKNGDFSQDFVSARNKLNGWCKGRWLFGDDNRKKFWKQVCK
ncbi:MAG: hypothetical protein J6S54_03555, partial [Lentisphaeria bacterium]|nr:hypothetical protein [Lentisphaeria bacterium]